jgi:glycosyltransferase involved in cell wall biosynthesis
MSLDCFPVNKSNAIRSLIIPAYNADWCLHDCVNSVIKQENKKFDEIIIAVDHCRKTLLTSLELSKKYPQIQVLWMTRHSHAYNTINAGLHYANGNILYVFGADDIMYENYTTEMEKNKSDIVCASGKTIEKGKVKKILKHTFGAIKISRTALEKLNYYEDWKCAADFELITRAKYSGIQVSHTNKDVMLIRKHDKNLTRKADTGMSSSLRTKYHTEIKNREKSLYQKTTKTILDYIQIKHGDPIPDVIKEEPPPIQTQVEKHKPKLVVVVCAVNIEIKKIEEWLQWNKENIEKINGAYLIVGFNMNAPIMEKYSPSKCSNAGIRKAIDSGADVVIKTDIDCKLSLDFLELASELEPGRCECPVCFFSGKSENRYKEAQCGTVAMHAKNWNDLYGYDERMYGYGWEDGDLIARIERKKIKISRHRDKFLIHVEHPKRFGSNWYPVNRNKNKSFRSWRSQNWGL